METIKNSLQTLYNHQNAAGALPYAGPGGELHRQLRRVPHVDADRDRDLLPVHRRQGVAGRDLAHATQRALNYITAKIGADGLLNVTASADWARANSGGKNIEAQAIMYRTLTTCAAVARVEGDTARADSCTQKAADAEDRGQRERLLGRRRRAVPRHADEQRLPAGRQLARRLVRARPSRPTGLAISAGAEQAAGRRSARSTPEKSATSVHPFPGSMEAMAHFEAGDDEAGLDLLRLEWGYMLNAPYGTASTFWEGYKTDGCSDYSGSYIERVARLVGRPDGVADLLRARHPPRPRAAARRTT